MKTVQKNKTSLLVNLDSLRDKKLSFLVKKLNTNKTHFILNMIDEAYNNMINKKEIDQNLPPAFAIGLPDQITKENIYTDYLSHKYAQ